MYGASVCLRAYVYVLPSFFCAGFLSRAVSTCMISFCFFCRAHARCSRICVFLCFFGALARAVVYVIPPFFARSHAVCVCVFLVFARALCACVRVCVCVFVFMCVFMCMVWCVRVCVIFLFVSFHLSE